MTDCTSQTVAQLRKSAAYRAIPRGERYRGRTKSRNTKQELCDRLGVVGAAAPADCLDTSLRRIRASAQYRAIPNGTVLNGTTKSRTPKAELCRVLRLYDVLTGARRHEGIGVVTLGRDPAGNLVQAVFINRNRAYGSREYELLMSMDVAGACAGLSGYAAGEYNAPIVADDPPSWLLMVVSVPTTRVCSVLAATLIWKHPGRKGVELDAVCGAKHTVEIRDTMQLLETRFEQIDLVEGRDASRGRASPLSLGSLLICLAIRWIMWSLDPQTPRIFLKSVPGAVSRYGTNGFVPAGTGITRRDRVQFARDTYGPKATPETMRQAQEYSELMSEGELLYMYMTNARARKVMRERCTDALGLIVTGMDIPSWLA